MVFEVCRVLILCNILGHVLVNGLPTGAPLRACETGTNIVPNHAGNTPSTSPVPYSVDLSNIPSNGYVPGRNYNIILRGSSSNTDFKGFMIQGRVRADDSPTGTFGTGINYRSRCTGNTAATHTSRDEKTSVTLVWTAPAAGTGCICFRYAFVDYFTLFWANQITSCISENLQTAIQASSSGSIRGNTFTISTSANVEGQFECSLNNGAFKTCSTGDTFVGLSAGSHSVSVRFTPNGHCRAITLRPPVRFNIIQPPTPSPTIRVGGSVRVRGNRAVVTLTANANGTFQCKLDGGGFQPCRSRETFSGLSAGAHTVWIQFTPFGSTQVLTLHRNFTIEMMSTVTPTPTPTVIQASGSATVSGNAANVTLSANVAGAFQCSLDGAAFQPCSTGSTFSGLSVGDHSIAVQFTPDGSSAVLTLQPSLTFTIMPPPTPTPQVPDLSVTATVAADKITISYNVDEEVDCTCQLDSDQSMPCTSGHMITDVTPGDHVVIVTCTSQETDLISTRQLSVSVSETERFIITGWHNVSGNNAQVFFNSTLPARCTCRLDRERPVACVSGHVYRNIEVGRHQIRVVCRLRANTRMRKELKLPRFTINPPTTAPPQPPRVTATASVFNNCSAKLTFSADALVTFRCRVNMGPWETCISGYVASGLLSDSNEIEIEATSTENSNVKTTVTATVDLTGQACPLLEITRPVCNPSLINGNNATFTFGANKPQVKFMCAINNSPASPCDEGRVAYLKLKTNMKNIITVTASTTDGETVSTNINYTSKYNRRFCQVYTCDVNTGRNSATIHFISDDPRATYRCKLDGRRIRRCTSPLQLTNLSPGGHELTVTPRCSSRRVKGKREKIGFIINPQ